MLLNYLKIIIFNAILAYGVLCIFPVSGNSQSISDKLTPEEQYWLGSHREIRVGVGVAFPPFQWVEQNKNGDYCFKGIVSDYLDILSKRLNVSFQIVYGITFKEALEKGMAKEIDLFPCLAETPERSKFLLFTKPYLSYPLVIISRNDSPFISKIEDLAGKKIAIVKSLATYSRLLHEYSEIEFQFVEADNTLGVLEAVSFGRADACIENLAAATYLIQKKGLLNLKIAAPSAWENNNLCMGIRNDWQELIPILEKALASITQEEKALIDKRWLAVRYEYNINIKRIWKWVLTSVICLFAIFSLFYLWNKKLRREVIHRKIIQTALEESEKRLQQIIHHMPVMLMAFDKDMRIIAWNKECEIVSGYSADEIIHHPHAIELINPQNASHQLSYHKDQDFRNLEIELRCRDGSIRTVSWSNISKTCPISGWHFWIVGFDISDRKKAEENLIKSQEKSRAILRAIPDLMFQLNRQGIFLDYHGSKEGLFEKPDVFIGKSVNEVLPPELAKVTMGAIDAVLRHRGIQVYEYDLRINNSLKYFESRMVPCGENEILAMIRDITSVKETQHAFKESERRYHTLINNLNIGVYRRTPGLLGRFIEANPAILKIFGYEDKDIFFSVSASDFYQFPEEAARFDYKMKKFGFVKNEELHLKKQNGKPFIASVSTMAVKDENGNILYFDGIIEDITERKNIEKQFLHAQKMEAIGTLTGGIAHDINNILMGIQGNISILMLDQSWTDQQMDRMKKIEQIIQQGADLTRHLLNFSRGGKDEVKPVNINRIVKEQIQIFGRTKKNIVTHETYESGLWIVEADSGQISQVLLNILINAWQAMPNGGNLFIRTENVVIDETYVTPYRIKYGRFVKISITDTGTGMSEDIRQRIFEPFFTTKETGKGTGLGLFTSFGIIKNHGGFISVYSEINIGSTFNIYLPASELQLRENITKPEELATGVGTILLVDDEEMILDSSKELVEALGYKAFISSSGKHALEFYRTHYSFIDLVILDMIMPGMSGSDVYYELQKINPKVKVIISSGYSMNGQISRLIENGCKSFIQKPFSLQDLSLRIQEALRSSD